MALTKFEFPTLEQARAAQAEAADRDVLLAVDESGERPSIELDVAQATQVEMILMRHGAHVDHPVSHAPEDEDVSLPPAAPTA